MRGQIDSSFPSPDMLSPLFCLLPLLAQSTERVSLTPAGAEIAKASGVGALSADGRFAVFTTDAGLVPADTNNRRDVYVRDRVAGTTSLASLSPAGTIGNGHSSNPSISGNGRFVVFDTASTDYVVPDANGAGADVYVRDLQAGTTTLVSKSSAGVQGNSGSQFAAISGDGRWVAFESSASNLVAGDLLGVQDVFLHDLLTGATLRVSVGIGGADPNAPSHKPDVSDDGSFVVYASNANNIVVNDTTFFMDVLRWERISGATILVSQTPLGVASTTGGSDSSAVSSDGQHVAFYSGATDLVSGDTNAIADIFLRDVLAGTTSRVSLDQFGGQILTGNPGIPAISGDASRVVFSHTATTLVPGDTNAVQDVFLRDVAAGVNTRISVSTAGVASNGTSQDPRCSSDGMVVEFTSTGSNLVPGDTNGFADAFVRVLAPAGPSLAKSGTCPGSITLTVAGASPGGSVAILHGPAGAFIKPGPPCAGLALAMSVPTLGPMLTANGLGGAALTFNAPAGACGRTVQAVDVAACAATNAVAL